MSRERPEKHDDSTAGLLEAVEQLRRKQFAHLDPALVRDILKCHAEGQVVDAELARTVEQVVERHLKGKAR